MSVSSVAKLSESARCHGFQNEVRANAYPIAVSGCEGRHERHGTCSIDHLIDQNSRMARHYKQVVIGKKQDSMCISAWVGCSGDVHSSSRQADLLGGSSIHFDSGAQRNPVATIVSIVTHQRTL